MKPCTTTTLVATIGALLNLTSKSKMYPAKKWVKFEDRKALHELVKQLAPLADESITEASRKAGWRGFTCGLMYGMAAGVSAIGVIALTQYLQTPIYWCGVVAGALCTAMVIFAARRG